MLSHVGLWLHVVESALVELITSRELRSATSPLWCTAQALDASAIVWRHLEQCPHRYRVLVELVDIRLAQQRRTRPTATAAAVSLRSAQAALQDLAAGSGSRAAALRRFDDAVVSLAALAVGVWRDVQHDRGRSPCDQIGHNPRFPEAQPALDLVRTAEAQRGPRPAEPDSIAAGLDAALAIPAPNAELDVLGQRAADRVLRAEALLVVRGAWVGRGARELRVLRALHQQQHGSGPPIRVPAGGAGHLLRYVVDRPVVVPAVAWEHHAVALARAANLHARRPDDDAVLAALSTTMDELVGDSVLQLTILDEMLADPDIRC